MTYREYIFSIILFSLGFFLGEYSPSNKFISVHSVHVENFPELRGFEVYYEPFIPIPGQVFKKYYSFWLLDHDWKIFCPLNHTEEDK